MKLFIYEHSNKYTIKYDDKEIKIFDCCDFSHKMIMEDNYPIILLHMKNHTIGYLGMCRKCQHKCQHNYFKIYNMVYLCNPNNIKIYICNVCQYLSHITIEINGVLLSSLHMCQCDYNNGVYIPHVSLSLNEEATNFLKNISLS